MSKESKAAIKQKKKERLQELQNKAKNLSPKTTGNVEVLEIFPREKCKPKFLAQGTVIIKMHDIGLKIKNIRYSVNKEGDCNVQPPFEYYRNPKERGIPDAYVESIKFDDKSIWKDACKVIREKVLEHHREELPKVAASEEKQPS